MSDMDSSEQYACSICGRTFESKRGRGSHRAQAHTEEEIEESMITRLQELNHKTDGTPCANEIGDYCEFGSTTYQNRFGSWNEALREANIELNKRGSIPKRELLNEINRLADKLNGPPTVEDIREHGEFAVTTYERRFGSWNESLNKAGLEYNIQSNISRSELIEKLVRFADELGGTPSKPEMNRQGPFSANTYIREFESWNQAIEQAGLQTNVEQNVSENKLIKEIKRLAEEDRAPSRRDMDHHGEFASSTYSREFGSWNEAIREAGLEINKLDKIPREKLLSEITRLADDLDSTPSIYEMNEYGRYGYRAYRNEFGSWNNAVNEAGLDTNANYNISKKKLKNEIQSLADQLNRAPTEREMDKYGKFSGGAYYRQFGSWNEAITESGLDPNQVRHPDHLDHLVRSTWEERIANMLVSADIDYSYESLKINYGGDYTYTPDFITDTYVIEVKGRQYRPERLKKKAIAARDYFDERDYVVVGTELPADVHIPWHEREDLIDLIK